MSSAWDIASCGMNTALLGLSVAAHNTENLETPDFHRQLILQRALASTALYAESMQPQPAFSESFLAAKMRQLQTSYATNASLEIVEPVEDSTRSGLNVKT